MTETIHLERTYNPALAREVTAFLTNTTGATGAPRPGTPKLDLLIADPAGILIVALKKGQIVGCAIAAYVNRHTYELLNLAVSKQYRGNGVGTQLLQDALRIAKDDHGATTAIITSPGQHASWLQRHGIQTLPADTSVGVLTRDGHIQVVRPNPRHENARVGVGYLQQHLPGSICWPIPGIHRHTPAEVADSFIGWFHTRHTELHTVIPTDTAVFDLLTALAGPAHAARWFANPQR